MRHWCGCSLLSAIVSTLPMLVEAGAVAQDERGTKMVPERPGRVYVMAGFDAGCAAVAPVRITIDVPPTQGSVSLREGQETVIQVSLTGNCVGRRIKGTGIYYTARAGATGADAFTVTARIGGGEPVTKMFKVKIADD
jgi:hypothetical protein